MKIQNTMNIQDKRNELKQSLVYVLIAIIPFAWYGIIKIHSYVHARFTYKDLSITIFCILLILFNYLSLFIKRMKKPTEN